MNLVDVHTYQSTIYINIGLQWSNQNSCLHERVYHDPIKLGKYIQRFTTINQNSCIHTEVYNDPIEIAAYIQRFTTIQLK
jgi:hypothetical protein